jgi:hypothetical protein
VTSSTAERRASLGVSAEAPCSVTEVAPTKKKRRPAWIWLGPLLCSVVVIYATWSAAGSYSRWPVYSTYFDLLGEGFRRGQLSLPIDPAPELLAAQNPYDRANGRYWLVDATLHDGKYYLYWGPLPPLLQAIAKTLLNIDKLIGDQYLLLFFSSLSALFGALLIEGLRRRMFSVVPRWVSACSILALAFANPVPYLLTSPAQYQVAIGAGQTFMLGGMLFAFLAVRDRDADSRRRRWLVLSGSCFGLALASRISLGGAAALVALFSVIASSSSSGSRLRSMLTNAIHTGVPALVCVALLLVYNKLRFDSFSEFGMSEQLSYFDFRVSKSYFFTNLYAYALTPFGLSCEFPYALQSWAQGPKGVASWVPLDKTYLILEPISGFLSTVPISWLFPVPVLVAAAHLRQVRRKAWQSYMFCTLSFAVLGSVSGALVLFVYSATMRYLADFIYGIVLLGVLGAFTWIATRRSERGRTWAGVGVASLCVATCVLGLLLGYQGYNSHFKSYNPELHRRLVDELSVCGLLRGD